MIISQVSYRTNGPLVFLSHPRSSLTIKIIIILSAEHEIKRIYDGVEAETRKSQVSLQIIQVSSEAQPKMRLE